MSEINQALGTAGAGYTLHAAGRPWLLLPLTQAAKGAFEDWLQARAWAAVRTARAYLPAEDYQQLLAVTGERIARGKCAVGSAAYHDALQSPEGLLFFLRQHLLPRHPTVTDAELLQILTEARAELFAVLGVMYPNVQSPAVTSPPGDHRSPSPSSAASSAPSPTA